MTKEQLWEKFCEVNPSFRTEYSVNLSVTKIRKMIETAHKYAYEAGFQKGKVVAATLNDLAKAAGSNRGGTDGFGAFKDIFGGLGKK